MRFSKDYKIKLSDMGLNFRAKHTAIIGYFQECFAQWCLEHKMTGYHLAQKGLMWVITNINMEIFNDLPYWSEDIRVEVWFSEVKKLRAYLEFRVYVADEVLAQGDSCWMVLDCVTRRPVAIDKIVESCGVEDEKIFIERKRIETDITGEITGELNFKATYSDLDYNGHVNNLSYLNWGVETLPEEFRNTCRVKNCSIVFHRECFLNDDIHTELYKSGNKFKFFVKRAENEETACMVELETEKISGGKSQKLPALMS